MRKRCVQDKRWAIDLLFGSIAGWISDGGVGKGIPKKKPGWGTLDGGDIEFCAFSPFLSFYPLSFRLFHSHVRTYPFSFSLLLFVLLPSIPSTTFGSVEFGWPAWWI